MKDDDTGVDLIQEFVKMDFLHIEELFWEYRLVEFQDPLPMPEEKRDGKRRPRVLTADERKLLTRLARANTYRRQQFGYWNHHRTKNAKETVQVLEDVGVGRVKNIIKPDQFATIMALNPPPSSKAFSRPTTATNLQNPSNIKFDDGASTMSARTIPPQAQGDHDEQVDIPEPPLSLKEKKYFLCPYCFTICSQSLLKKEAWR